MLVSASIAKMYWKIADEYGISRAELLRDAGLTPEQIDDPNALVPRVAADDLLRALMRRTQDPALGLALARAFDLRAMGFWGYALLSSLTLGQRIQLHLRYNKLHSPTSQLAFRVEGDRAIVDFSLPDIPADVLPVILDFGLAVTCTQLGKHIGCAQPDVALWLCIPELPHHSALRAMVAGPVQFDAPHVRVSIPAKELDRRLPGDPHLLELAKAQLEAQLAKVSALLSTDVLVLVRERLSVRLAHDASLERVAADLRLSARTLRRRLSAVGATFHALLDEARRVRAIRDVLETDQAIEHVAQGVGYRDPANFRRAFRRWTGAAPAAFRAERRRPGD